MSSKEMQVNPIAYLNPALNIHIFKGDGEIPFYN
jgi:hypothetical protein